LLSFTNTGGQNRYFTTARLDFNLSSKHHLEGIWNYNAFRNVMDFLNTVDPAFPAPFPQIFGGQQSNRFSFVTALRSQLSGSVVNEARFGFDGGTITFCSSGCAPGDFAPFNGVAKSPGAHPETSLRSTALRYSCPERTAISSTISPAPARGGTLP